MKPDIISFQGRVAIVTGAGAGLGRGIAEAFGALAAGGWYRVHGTGQWTNMPVVTDAGIKM